MLFLSLLICLTYIKYTRCIGEWELDDNKSTLQELGIYAVIADIQRNAFQILEALDNNSTIDLSEMLSFIK
jgi:hypothetical protein